LTSHGVPWRVLVFATAATLTAAVAAVPTLASQRPSSSSTIPRPGGAPLRPAATAASPQPPPAPPNGPVVSTTTAVPAVPTSARGLPTTSAGTFSPPVLNDSTLSRLTLTTTSTAGWTTVSLVGVRGVSNRVVKATPGVRIEAIGDDPFAVALQGSGTATVEAVGAVLPTTNTSIRICKSDGGIVRSDVTRLTYGAIPVATASDTRSDDTIEAGCHDSVTSPLSHASILGPTAWPPLLDTRHLVLAFYYPWYDGATFNTGPWGGRPTGAFNTADPAQVDAMVAQAATSGIGGFVVSYNGYPGLLPRVDAVVAAARVHPGFQVSALAELDNLAGPSGSVSAAALEGWFQGILPLTNDASWLRVAGRPVIFLFSQWRVSPATWTAVRSWLAARDQDPFVMGQGLDPAFPVDGLYQYTPNVVKNSTQLVGWYESWEYQARIQTALDPDPRQVLWASPVSPGEDDSRLGRPQDRTVVVPRASGSRYDQAWQAALATRPDWLLVSTWNEFYENTEVSPSTTDGSMALSQTAAWASRFSRMS